VFAQGLVFFLIEGLSNAIFTFQASSGIDPQTAMRNRKT
jgi:hypothetical protein